MRNRRKENNRYINFIINFLISVVLVIFTNPARSVAKVTGKCDNCHTMHTSQEGTSSGTLPSSALTKVDCIGCHSNTENGDTIIYVGGLEGEEATSRIPIVYNTKEPTEGTELAAGNFYWMTVGDDSKEQKAINDSKGHNILAGPEGTEEEKGISEKDSVLDDAPGRLASTAVTEDCQSCHKYLNGRTYNIVFEKDDYPELIGEPYCGCKSCHTYIGKSHHADDHERNEPDKYNNLVDHNVGCYRFLAGHKYPGVDRGVHGIESYDWEKSKGGDCGINQYQGSDIDADSDEQDHSISDFCGGCHGNYHAKNKTSPGGLNASPWFRHPAHIGLPAGGEFDAYTEYNLDAPVARKDLSSYIDDPTKKSNVIADGYGGNDQVMCLSCHRAHASRYPGILRWDYEQVVADDDSDENKGCKICHTGKN